MNRTALVLLAAEPFIGPRADTREVAPMQWHNPPAKWTAAQNAITLEVMPKTDYWRTTHYGYNRDSGHFYYREIAGDFVARVKVKGSYRELYDQAGPHDPDRRDGLDQGGDRVREQLAERQHRRHPRVLGLVGGSLANAPSAIWLELVRKSDYVEVRYSLDGRGFHRRAVQALFPPGHQGCRSGSW